jgi:hypothetical protein
VDVNADSVKPQISPLRFASVEMTNLLHRKCLSSGRLNSRSLHYATLRSKNISKTEHQHRDLSTALRFGRDDKGEVGAPMERG